MLRWLGLGPLTLDFQEKEMATITIKDLSENVELDRKAMQAITGGSRWRSQGAVAPQAQAQRGNRIFSFRGAPVRKPAAK